MTRLTTERLTLTDVTQADAEFVLELLNDPGWIANIGDRGVRTLEEARAYIADRFDKSLWLVARDAESGEPLGLCGIVASRPGLEISDLGYAFLARHSGKGYATEAARAVLDWGFRDLELERITAMIHAGNQASIAVAERLGFTPRREDQVLGKPCIVWALDRPQASPSPTPTPLPNW